VDDALCKHKLVSHEATIFTDDPVHCFLHVFLDEWACKDFPTKHLDICAFRQDVKKWLRDNYKLLHLKEIIEDWLTEYPHVASRIKEAGLRGQSIKKVKNQEWQFFCNDYALNGFLASGIHLRKGDNYTCFAVANIYIATVNVHMGLESPMRFTPYTDGSYCTINLVQYCAPKWKHFRSTRPLLSPPASPGPAYIDLAPAAEGPMRRASSEATSAEPPLILNEMVPVDVGPASQSSQETEGAEFLSPQQVPEPENLEMLEETLLHSPYGSKDPYQFYHVLKVAIKTTLPQIEVPYRKISMLYHPDRHATKTFGLFNFRSSRPSKARSQTPRNDKNITVNPGRPLRMPSGSVDVPQRLHRMGSGNTCGNAKHRLQLHRGRAVDEPLMPQIRQMQTRLHHTESAATRRQRM
jgi:hypothetical protein